MKYHYGGLHLDSSEPVETNGMEFDCLLPPCQKLTRTTLSALEVEWELPLFQPPYSSMNQIGYALACLQSLSGFDAIAFVAAGQNACL
jgi:hypothetical protein